MRPEPRTRRKAGGVDGRPVVAGGNGLMDAASSARGAPNATAARPLA